MKNKTPNRRRKNQLKIYLDDDEMTRLEQNIARSGIRKKSEYIRQMILYGKVFKYDDTHLKNCYTAINKMGVNLNQMAKVANETGSIYREDIEKMRRDHGYLSQYLNMIYRLIEVKEQEVRNSDFETLTEQVERAVKEYFNGETPWHI